jgi:hypothetical protein
VMDGWAHSFCALHPTFSPRLPIAGYLLCYILSR